MEKKLRVEPDVVQKLQARGRGRRVVQRFRGGLVFKAHRRLCHSTLGLRVIKKKKRLSHKGST